MRRLTLVGVLAGALIVSGAPSTFASSPLAVHVSATANWSMVPLTKDVDRDGVIDGDGGVPRTGSFTKFPSKRFIGAGNRVAQPNERLIDGVLSWYLPDGAYPVRLNACGSRGDDYRWIIDGVAGSWTPLTRKRCASTVDLAEGDHAAVLEVRSGKRRAASSLTIDVVHHLVVAMGDSYASGEGNPRNVDAWLREPSSFDPYWDDDNCRRSVLGGPSRAALALEQSSPRSSVTFVNVTCSGATIDAGILGPMPSSGQTASQIELARRVIGNRAIDAVLLSIGGNDVGFGTILETCILRVDCPLVRATSGELRIYPTLNDGVQARTAMLPAAFAKVAACLGGTPGTPCVLTGPGDDAPLSLARDAAVIPALYPDITRSATGQSCSLLTMDADDFSWARSSMLVPDPAPTVRYRRTNGTSATLPTPSGSLNQQVLATSALGWRPATGFWDATGTTPEGHGVCAGTQAWIFGVTALAGLPTASFHPNPTGQQRLGDALLGALKAAVVT